MAIVSGFKAFVNFIKELHFLTSNTEFTGIYTAIFKIDVQEEKRREVKLKKTF